MKLPRLAYVRPSSIAEAVRILAESQGDARLLAGGQSLVPMLAFRLAAPDLLVDISEIAELRGIDISLDAVTLGACVRWVDLERHAGLRDAMPLVPAVVEHIAHYQVRNRGTVGGSLAHCDPAAEMPGLAVACDAQIILQGPSGQRVVAAGDVLLGALSADFAFDEMIVAVRFPRWPAGHRWGFCEFARRKGDFALAGAIVHFGLDAEGRARNVRVGIIGASDRPLRVVQSEAVLEGQVIDVDAIRAACDVLRREIDPPSDMHASADYRRALAGVMAERALAQAMGLSMDSTDARAA